MNNGAVVAIRHVGFEHAGTLEACLGARGHAVRYCEAGIDDLADLDPCGPKLLVVLGGPIGAYEEAVYPFLNDELRVLETRLAAGLPTLGICLGAQLMARALGGRVYPAPGKEIGWAPVTLTEAGQASPLGTLEACDGMVLHWHGDTFDLPDRATRLASTALCVNQAFGWGAHALGLQFHVEIVSAEIERWLIGHACEIAGTKDVTVEGIRADTRVHGPRLEAAARSLFARWLAEVGL